MLGSQLREESLYASRLKRLIHSFFCSPYDHYLYSSPNPQSPVLGHMPYIPISPLTTHSILLILHVLYWHLLPFLMLTLCFAAEEPVFP